MLPRWGTSSAIVYRDFQFSECRTVGIEGESVNLCGVSKCPLHQEEREAFGLTGQEEGSEVGKGTYRELGGL